MDCNSSRKTINIQMQHTLRIGVIISEIICNIFEI